MFSSFHALDRFRIHHPEANMIDVLESFESSVEIDSQALSVIALRGKILRSDSIYRVSSDGMGVFVVRVRSEKGIPYGDFPIVTYRHMRPGQRRALMRYMDGASDLG